MTRTATFDPAFEAWLQSLPALGYPRDWVIRNMTVLERRYRETGGAAMPACPPPPESRRYDPYEGI